MSNRCAVSGVFGTGGNVSVSSAVLLVVGNGGAGGNSAGG